jgi:hypothetical protein
VLKWFVTCAFIVYVTYRVIISNPLERVAYMIYKLGKFMQFHALNGIQTPYGFAKICKASRKFSAKTL